MATRRGGSFADTGGGDDSVLGRAAPWPPPLPLVGGSSRADAGGNAHVPADGTAFNTVQTKGPAITEGRAAARRHWLEIVFLLGLASVFLANAVVAWLQPAAFTQLVQESRIGGWLGLDEAGWLAAVICVNDLLVGFGVLAAIWSRRAPQRLILAWAGIWLLAVTVLKMTALGVNGST